MKRADVARYWEENAETWTRHARAGHDVYRDALNTPAFLSMLPSIAGLRGLDIGCGEGSNTRELARRGANICAIDVAPTFIRYARAAEAAMPLGVVYFVADGTELPFAAGSFDFTTAFMSMMDMHDQRRALSEVRRVLKPGGFLQFSILHPCFVPPYRRVLREANGKTRAIEVSGYFDEIDGRLDTWWFSTLPPEERKRTRPFRTPRFHRTLALGSRSSARLGSSSIASPNLRPARSLLLPSLSSRTRASHRYFSIFAPQDPKCQPSDRSERDCTWSRSLCWR